MMIQYLDTENYFMTRSIENCPNCLAEMVTYFEYNFGGVRLIKICPKCNHKIIEYNSGTVAKYLMLNRTTSKAVM